MQKEYYSDTVSKNTINHYGTDQSTLYDSQSFLIEDNIVIPIGAHGVCVNANGNNLNIDFGDGILVLITVFEDNNRAKNSIENDGKEYNIVVGNRTPCLYFLPKK